MTLLSKLSGTCTLVLSLLSPAGFAADPEGSGPQSSVAYSDPGLISHTIYRPATLTGAYPVVLWGNGSCANTSFGYREFLADIASHGFIVLAVGPYRDTPAPRMERPADPAAWPEFETRPEQLLDGLDWVVAESGRAQSDLFQHVDTTKVAVMGHSCGGLQALKVSVDPRITTTLVLNSGLFPDGDQYMARFGLQRSVLDELHAPIAYFIGGETDIVYPNAELDWEALTQLSLPAANLNMDVGHGATYAMPQGGPFAEAPLAWLHYQLKSDAKARSRFVGDDCGFCTHALWRMRSRLLD